MKYEDLLNTIREIITNENIKSENLTLVYSLSEKNHRQMNEELFFRTKTNGGPEYPEYKDEFEVSIGGILVKFVKMAVEVVE